MSRRVRVVGTLLLTAAAVAYLVWKLDLGMTIDVLKETSIGWFAVAILIMVLTVPVLAMRWGWLLRSHGIVEHVPWLTRAYFVAYAAGQLLPTSLGGDAVRVVDTVRRHPGRTADVTGTVLLERGVGGAATVLLGAIGFLLAIGRYDVSAYLWLEGLFVFGTIVVGFLFFARSARPLLRRLGPLLERIRVAKPLRPSTRACTISGVGRVSCSRSSSSRSRCRPSGSSRSGPARGRWGSSSACRSTT